MECIFCKIVEKKAPAEIIYEDNKVIAFKDIEPRARLHFLVIPKKHIPSLDCLKDEDKDLIGELFLVVKKIAKEKKLSGYKVLINVGNEQIIGHLHLNLLSGGPMKL